MSKKNQKNEGEIPDNERESCFVIMPISNQVDYDHGHFRLVYEDIIKPAIENVGMKPARADETVNTNIIQLDILRKIIDSDIVICDMSSKNPNVFYELGVRQAFDKPTVLMIDDVTDAPFDVSSLRYVEYSKNMGYRDVKDAVERLTSALRETFEKRDDRSEINSLIRLLDLTTPAVLASGEVSNEERKDAQLSEIMSSLHALQKNQMDMMRAISTTKAPSTDQPDLFNGSKHNLSTLAKRAILEGEKRKLKSMFNADLENLDQSSFSED